MEIEFDPAKDAANRGKHGIGLAFASVVLADPRLVSTPDSRQDYGEERVISIGRAAGRVFVIVHTRRGGRERIISARRANARERRQYDTTSHQA